MLREYLKSLGDRYELVIRYISRLDTWYLELCDGLLKRVYYLPFEDLYTLKPDQIEATFVGILKGMEKELEDYKKRMEKLGEI